MKTTILIISAISLALTSSAQQCDSLDLGTVDTPSLGAQTTPFPTAFRGSKTQYLIPASELNVSGCGSTMLHGFSMTVVDQDQPVLLPAAPALSVQVRVGQTTLSQLVMYDVATSSSAPVASFQTGKLDPTGQFVVSWVIDPGQLIIAFDQPISWDGVQDLVLDISYVRAPYAGISPRVMLDTGLTYVATVNGMDHSPTFGWSFDDVTHYPPSATFGHNNTRPVMKWYTVPVTPTYSNSISTDVTSMNGLEALGTYPNPVSGQLTVELEHGIERLTLTDVKGAIVLDRSVSNSGHKMQLDLGAVEDGIYLLRTTDVNGAISSTQRVVVAH